MSLQLPFGVRVLNPFPVEDKYLNNGVPYSGTSQVNSLLAIGVRHTGLTVNIGGVEYWYATGVTNSSLVLKSPSVVSGGGITGATNGLTKTGAKVKLGGTLTGNTTLEGGGKNFNLGSSTSLKRFNIVTSGSSDWQVGDVFLHTVNFNDSIYMSNGTGIELHSGSGNVGNLYLNFNGAQGPLLSAKTGFPLNLQGGNSNVVNFQLQNAPHQFLITDNRAGTGQTGVEYLSDYSANFSPRSLVDKGYVTGITSTISVPVTGATNGLSVQSGKVVLGGSLNQGTSIFGDDTTPFLINIAQGSSPFGGSSLAMSNNSGVLRWDGTGNVGTSRFESGNGYFQVLAAEAANLPTPRSFSFFWLPNNGVTLGVASGATGTQVRMYQTGLTFYSTYSGFKGVQYAVDYSANFSPRSLVDKGYVTGLTSSSGLQTANNGLTKSGTNVHLGGSLTGNTIITGNSFNFDVSANRVKLDEHGGGILLTEHNGGGIFLQENGGGIFLQGTNGGIFIQESSGGGIGIGRSIWNNGGINITDRNAIDISSRNASGSVIFDLNLNATGAAVFTDQHTGATAHGLQYNADYSAGYTSRSLVDKAYTDSIAAGLDPKQAVHVATTVALTGATYHATGGTTPTGSFTSAPTIVDGITLANGNRILVKNQVDPKQNGIYTVISAGTWYRSSDLDGTPAAEVASGDFLFVQTGATLAATGWVLTGNGTLTINTDPLNFVQFSAANSYIAGSGISIVGNTISNLHTYSNGLTKTGNVVKLGGTLTSDVDIEGNSGNTAGLYIGANSFPVNFYQLIAGDASYSNFSSQKLLSNRSEYQFVGSGLQKAFMKFDSTGIDLRGGFNSGNGDTVIHLGGNTTHSTYFKDSRTGTGQTGFEYFANYSANFSPRSLVDKGYVTGLTSSISVPVTGATNGLSVVNKNVVLGGTLTGTVNIDAQSANNQSLILGSTTPLGLFRSLVGVSTSSNFSFFNQNQSSITARVQDAGNNIRGLVQVNTTGADMYSSSGGTIYSRITMGDDNTGTFVVTDGRTGSKRTGMQYFADYSANFTPRSLVDKGYVTGLTSSSGIQTANNGLTKSGTNVHLGGTLTGNTSIEGTGKTLNIGNVATVGAFNVKAGISLSAYNSQITTDDNGFDVNFWNNTFHLGRLLVNASGVLMEGFGATSSVATSIFTGGDGDGNLLITDNRGSVHGIEYAADYSAGYSARSLVDKAFVTGQTSGSKLRTIVLVSSNTTLASTTDLALVATTGGTFTVTLPATPTDGYHVIIKDDSGNAFTNNITVNGNGHNIDGASTFTINTDFGGAEATFSSARNKWYVTAFVS